MLSSIDVVACLKEKAVHLRARCDWPAVAVLLVLMAGVSVPVFHLLPLK